MLTGAITNAHDDLSKFVKAYTGARYRFHAEQLLGLAAGTPREGEEVVFELNAIGRTAKALRRYRREKMVPVSMRCWLPAQIISSRVATTRFVSAIYLSIAQIAVDRLETKMPLLVRLQAISALGSALQALEVQVLTGERDIQLSQALTCD
jgi:hypothetical protein